MNHLPFDYCDSLGPRSILHVHEPGIGLRGILVIDNVATGPAIGGLRMAPDVSLDECFRLARAMTFKNAAAGLAHGGGKAVIVYDDAADRGRKEQWVRAFASAIRPLTDFIVGPDMGTNETTMGWIKNEIGRCVGLPREIGGIPLDEIGATGFGVAIAAAVAARHGGPEVEGARIAVQGFGSVGKHAARYLTDRGAVLVAAGDSHGTVHNAAGLDVGELIRIKAGGGHLTDFAGGEHLARDDVIGVDCDILIPAARPDAVRQGNAADVRAKLVVQGANIGVTDAAERILTERGVLCIPDFVSNAGGVICAAVEYRGGTQSEAFVAIEDKIRTNTSEVLERAAAKRCLPREAAIAMAEERIRKAMRLQRWR